jgi:hypothetical protein
MYIKAMIQYLVSQLKHTSIFEKRFSGHGWGANPLPLVLTYFSHHSSAQPEGSFFEGKYAPSQCWAWLSWRLGAKLVPSLL